MIDTKFIAEEGYNIKDLLRMIRKNGSPAKTVYIHTKNGVKKFKAKMDWYWGEPDIGFSVDNEEEFKNTLQNIEFGKRDIRVTYKPECGRVNIY